MDSATDFDDELYYKTIAAANFSDELITRHSEIMNRYDPEKKIGLVIGEWGCWHNVEEGTNPGFLYQQNTMRDAIVAAIELNVFNRHSDRVVMANLAQAVNVLQSAVSYTHLTLPTKRIVEISGGAVSFKKKKRERVG